MGNEKKKYNLSFYLMAVQWVLHLLGDSWEFYAYLGQVQVGISLGEHSGTYLRPKIP